MGFTTPCFIRKSTEELTEKVYKLGGRDGRSYWHCDYLNLLLAEKQQFTCLDDELGNSEMLIKNGFIDCGVNEELFLAIASLRDDTDNNQLFTNGRGDWGIYRDNCKEGGLSGMDFFGMPNDFDLSHYHKATVYELIEHFKI